MIIKFLVGALSTLGLGYSGLVVGKVIKNKNSLESTSWTKSGMIGFIGNFFDTLGIGSFAIIVPLLKIFKQASVKQIPGTLNAGCTIPTIAEALIFISIIEVDPVTLLTLIICSSIGAWLGAGFVVKLSEHKIQLGMGVALTFTASFILVGQLHLLPDLHGMAIGLAGWKLIAAMIVYFSIGALAAIGIGGYAPSLALAFLLGLSPKAIFPIMMCSSAFYIPVAATKFVQKDIYNKKSTLAISIGGVAGVLLAAYVVKSLPINLMQWLVCLVLFYTGISMLHSYTKHT